MGEGGGGILRSFDFCDLLTSLCLCSVCVQLVQESYPGLLDSSRPQKVEIFVPLGQQSGSTTSTTTSDNITERDDLDISLGLPGGAVLPPPDLALSGQPLGTVMLANHLTSSSWRTGEVVSPTRRFSNISWGTGEITTSSRKPSDIDSHPRGPTSLTSPTVNDVVDPSWRPNGTSCSPGKGTDPVQVSKVSEASWEVLSKFSTTSHRLSIQQDLSDPHLKLVPLWECLQVLSLHAHACRCTCSCTMYIHVMCMHIVPLPLILD